MTRKYKIEVLNIVWAGKKRIQFWTTYPMRALNSFEEAQTFVNNHANISLSQCRVKVFEID
jgi:hypothetical protein